MAFQQQHFPIAFNSSVTNLSLTSALRMPGTYNYVYLSIPTMSVGYSVASTPIYLMVSNDDVTYRRYAEVGTSIVTNDFIIASALSNRVVYIPYFAAQYVKLEISGTVTAPASQTSGFQFICVSNQ